MLPAYVDLKKALDSVHLIFAESLEVLVMALEALHEEAKPLGLEVSWLKTKVQVFGDIKYEDLLRQLNELTVVDVRTRDEVREQGQLPGSHDLPARPLGQSEEPQGQRRAPIFALPWPLHLRSPGGNTGASPPGQGRFPCGGGQASEELGLPFVPLRPVAEEALNEGYSSFAEVVRDLQDTSPLLRALETRIRVPCFRTSAQRKVGCWPPSRLFKTCIDRTEQKAESACFRLIGVFDSGRRGFLVVEGRFIPSTISAFCSGLMRSSKMASPDQVLGKGTRDGAAWHVPRPTQPHRPPDPLHVSDEVQGVFWLRRTESLPHSSISSRPWSQRTQLDGSPITPACPISSWSLEEHDLHGVDGLGHPSGHVGSTRSTEGCSCRGSPSE
ncbi:hypothetical protein GWK47_028009 [Chionoecetes opilio]|uniref:Uncharacterized protein n=1 Tax=Chionoecetes opilio TaxID=41210 RepID=A0A8J4YLG1_CHIOP|nr:hypothetical protein GWK47_028009 [Chionoecetes opilio]